MCELEAKDIFSYRLKLLEDKGKKARRRSFLLLHVIKRRHSNAISTYR